MKKQALTLAQLCMMFDRAEAALFCIERDIFQFDWQADHIFSLPERVRNIGFVHLSERPSNDDHAFYLSFSDDEYFAIRGNNNEVVANLCDIFVQYGKAIRQRHFTLAENEEKALEACLCDSFVFSTDDLTTENAAYTEFVWKRECYEQVLARFKRSVSLPFEFFEQRKIGEFNHEFGWGATEDETSNIRKEDVPLSEIYVRYYDPAGDKDPIEIPLRVDHTSLPAYLFDFALILGLEETEETEKTEA